MFIGHGLLAFALVAVATRWFGGSAERALALGAVAGLFATLPDVDILYGPVGILGGVTGIGDAVDTFWATGNVTHRGPTHSLLVGAVAATGFALFANRSLRTRILAGVVLGATILLAWFTSGLLDATILTVFMLGGVAIVVAGQRVELLRTRLDLTAGPVLVAALVGLLSHPFGDLLTGTPPDLLYPLSVELVPERLVLHPDPTIHLLGAFAVELAVIWIAVAVYFRLTDRSLTRTIDPKAGLGAVYGAAVFVLPAPTVDAASPFVFSVLSIGLIGVMPSWGTLRPELDRALATGLAAVTLGATAYAVGYLLL